MDAFSIGPFLVSLPRVYALFAALMLLVASLVLLGLSRHRHVWWFNGTLISWLLGARLGHVLTHADSYAQAPLDILKFWQPGYHGLWGLLAASIWTAWALRNHFLRLMGGIVLLVGCSALWLVLVTLKPLAGEMALDTIPELTLANLKGESVALRDLPGDHVLINLWATWCPPCLREMPLLEEVDTRDDVSVAVVNQGEELVQVVRYLDEQGLTFSYPLLDPQQQLMALVESPGLPTTLLFDGEGRLLERHVGELSRAQLEGWLGKQ